VKTLAEAAGPAFPAGRMLISTPEEIAAVVAGIPTGRIVTLSALRSHLARRHGADYTCPVTTGIFLRRAAEKPGIPVWRIVRDDGSLLERLPGGMAAQADRLASEGHRLVQRGKRWRVLDIGMRAWDPR